jgi:inorganic pyrophosphatase
MTTRKARTPIAKSTISESAQVNQFRPHPWHGLPVGPKPPELLNAYIEITPFDLMKYEVDKVSGYLRVDRPQRSSAQPPTLYGFIPQTYCSERVRRLAPGAKRGDGDPLDVCVLSERTIARTNHCALPGHRRLTNDHHGEADDKIIAVLENDYVGEAVTSTTFPTSSSESPAHF